MKKRTLLLVICILLACLIPQSSQPCTTFYFDDGDQPVFGRNFDWMIGDALVIVNKRNVSKTAMVNDSETGISQPVSWTSQFGSVTFNMICRELPMGGINEAGLVVELMMLVDTQYPEPDSRPYTNSLQWIQYQLDNFGTVEEVIASDSQLRIRGVPADYGNHYLVSDRNGSCASIEFLDGKLVYYANETMPAKVLTNSTYEESTAFLYEHIGWGGDLQIPQSDSSLDRFVRAADMVKNYDPGASESAVDYAFDILADVSQSVFVHTQWSIAYDIKILRIYFHTLENEKIRYIDLSSFDFSCRTPVKVLDINEDLSGDISNNFVDYSYEMNRDLIENNYPDMSDEDIDALANYPETTICMENCFIATATYGSTMEPQVEVLREFRDRFLFDNALGKTFVKLYNTHSPALADLIARNDSLRKVVRLGLLPIVGMSWFFLKIGPVPAMLLMILLMALISIAAAAVWRKNRNRKVKYER